MSELDIINEAVEELRGLNEKMQPLPERVTNPTGLRAIHDQYEHNDEEGSYNRAAQQELIDFVPPYDNAELEERGQSERFNVNFGMVSSIVTDAVGSYMDIFQNPTSILKLELKAEVTDEDANIWAATMGEEFTTMIREWDGSTPKMLLLNQIQVAHGIAISNFIDKNNIFFEVASLEDFKFDDSQEAISSTVEAATFRKTFEIVELYENIEDGEVDADGFNAAGWHVKMGKELIARSGTTDRWDEDWSNYESIERKIKANRVTGTGRGLPAIEAVFGYIKEMDGTYSLYGCAHEANAEGPEGAEPWLFRQRHKFDTADQLMQIFPFSVGNKNLIYTIRGLSYFLYEIGQADNMIRSKVLDAVRSNLSPTYQPAGGIDSQEDMQILDTGPAQIIPPGLKSVQVPSGLPLDRTAEAGMAVVREIMDKHSGGLASPQLQNPSSRRNQLEVASDIENVNKLLAFALNLYYPPYEKLWKEVARRAFEETQTNLYAQKLVKEMKKRCVERGVPKEVFRKIDWCKTKATRVLGAGSRGARMLLFNQLSQMFAEMDPQGREKFSFDMATELVGYEKAVDYFGKPTERRGHVDMTLARLENSHLVEGEYIEPTEGENRLVHLEIHLAEGLEPGLQGVEEGQVDLAEYVTTHITLFQHFSETLEVTTVHDSLMPRLKSIMQRGQQIGEIIENGMRQLNAEMRRQQEEEGAMQEQQLAEGGEGQPSNEEAREDAKLMQELERKAIEAQAKIEVMQRQSEAALAIKQQESMAKIALMDAETAAKVRRESMLVAAKAKSGS